MCVYVCVCVCVCVCHKTLTLPMTFELHVCNIDLGISYVVCVFLVSSLFQPYQNILPCDLDIVTLALIGTLFKEFFAGLCFRMPAQKTRVCVIGAGPSGMCALYQLGKMTSRPEVVCYEKQSTWGGMWNLTWRTGTSMMDEIDKLHVY